VYPQEYNSMQRGSQQLPPKRSRILIMSAQPKKAAQAAKKSPPPVATEGVAIARENRTACNSLGDDAREALTLKAMSLIYGGTSPVIPARRA
jgi:hypothetical protein